MNTIPKKDLWEKTVQKKLERPSNASLFCNDGYRIFKKHWRDESGYVNFAYEVQRLKKYFWFYKWVSCKSFFKIEKAKEYIARCNVPIPKDEVL